MKPKFIALALAWPTLAGADPSCFVRDYDAAHLAKSPAQIVQSITVLLPDDPRRDGMRLSASFADQGHVAGTPHSGQTLIQGLFCLTEDGPLRCGVECDGGLLTVTRQDAKVLEFQTDYLTMGDSEQCGGTVDLAEIPGQSVTYRLFKTDLARCDALRVD